ncbi:uracil-DNA glycosylase family protein [Agrobacterium tumefaciens]|uniref:uracil-DNA glycosylase family protein n=1 Tax=Agrobacterium tumefaciens TaxID=358 RepID=UPI0022449200|nr:uracil-DNA glycosylase family protein [Agrobacterium tumefaciens]MCW8060212.1 uracil-DNA glycosylase [Agrobacterium tumefaciens]MCW8147000.1 uracil-DNA glycosylase [Agrobacterium tumefaciens]
MTYRGPDTLWHEHRRDGRLAILDSPHMRPLNDYRNRLRKVSGRDIPNFDPFDGGVSARLLILLETPGPSAVTCDRRFVSIDNPTGTAKNLRDALAHAGIKRHEIIVWNTVPWVRLTKTPITIAERSDGIDGLADLLPMLSAVKAAVLAGAVAGEARQVIEQAGIETILAPHPSPVRINTSPTLRERLYAAFVAAGKTLDRSKSTSEIS